jgi:hypothetical protein
VAATLLLAVALGVISCRLASKGPPVQVLSSSLDPVRAAFNQAADRTRVVTLLSPT